MAADLVDRTFVTGTHSLRRPGRHRPPLGAARDGRGGDENRVPVRRVRGALAVGRHRVGPHHRRRAPAGAAGGGRPADRPDRERPRPGRGPVPAADPRRDRRPRLACRVAAREAARAAAGVPGTGPPGRVRLRSPRTRQGPAAQLRPGHGRPGCPGPRCTRRWKPSRRGTWWNPSTAGGSSCPAPACSCWPSSSAAWSRSAPRSAGTAANGPRTGGRCGSSTTTPRPPTVVGPVEEAEAYLWPPEPPPEDGETLMDLLHRELGAYLISG